MSIKPKDLYIFTYAYSFSSTIVCEIASNSAGTIVCVLFPFGEESQVAVSVLRINTTTPRAVHALHLTVASKQP